MAHTPVAEYGHTGCESKESDSPLVHQLDAIERGADQKTERQQGAELQMQSRGFAEQAVEGRRIRCGTSEDNEPDCIGYRQGNNHNWPE